tara:strand:- start:235 stop:381 length:147 start_codon:yes stop_codon:yes gene_type:complete
MADSLKTVTVGITGSSLPLMTWLPQTVGLIGGILTAVYMAIKIYKELK